MIAKKVVYSQTFVFRVIFIIISIKISCTFTQFFDSPASIFGSSARGRQQEAPGERFNSNAADQLKSKLLANLNKYSVSTRSAGRTKSSTNEQVFVDDDRLEALSPATSEREDTPTQGFAPSMPDLFGNIFSISRSSPQPPSPSFLAPPLLFPTLPPPPSFSSLAPITIFSSLNSTTTMSPPTTATTVPQESIIRNFFAQAPPKITHSSPSKSQTYSKSHASKWQKLRFGNHQQENSSSNYFTRQIPLFLNRTSTSPPSDSASFQEEEHVDSAQAIGNYRRRMYKQMHKEKKKSKSGNDEASQILPDKMELLKRLTANTNGSLLLLMLNDENSKTSTSKDNDEEDSKNRRADELAHLFGVESNIPVPIQTPAISTAEENASKYKSLYLADGWLRSLASPSGIHLFLPQPQSLAREETSDSSSQNHILSLTLAPPVAPQDLLPSPSPYSPSLLLSEYASSAPTTLSPIGRKTTHQPESYVKDLSDLGEDYDLANRIGGAPGKKQEEDYEEQLEPCPSAPTTCASNSALGAATWLSGHANEPAVDDNTEMCNSRRLSALIRDTIVSGDPEASKRAIQGRAEAEFGGFYNVVCGTGFYSYIAHTDEFCLASANDINCYVFSPVCSLRPGLAAGIARRRMAATRAAFNSWQRRWRKNKRNQSSFQRLVNSRKYYSSRRRKAFLNRN